MPILRQGPQNGSYNKQKRPAQRIVALAFSVIVTFHHSFVEREGETYLSCLPDDFPGTSVRILYDDNSFGIVAGFCAQERVGLLLIAVGSGDGGDAC